MDLSKYIDLLPDVYDKNVNPKSNIRKIFEVLEEVFQVLIDSSETNREIKDIALAEGAVLDAIGEDYGIGRYGKNDEDYRALILAKIFARISGNTVDKILTYISFVVPGSTAIVRNLTEPALLPLFNNREIWRAITVDIDPITPEQRDIVLAGLQSLKAAGITLTVNLESYYTAGQYYWAEAEPVGLGVSANYEFARYHNGNVYAIDVSRKDAMIVATPAVDYTFGAIPAIAGAPIQRRLTGYRSGTEYIFMYTQFSPTESTSGMFRSTTDATSFAVIPLPAKPNNRELVIGAIRSNVITLIVKSASTLVIDSVRMSTNYGVSWLTFNPGGGSVYSPQIELISKDGENIPQWAAFGSIVCIPYANNGGPGQVRVMRSTDNGASWTTVLVQSGTTQLGGHLARSNDGRLAYATTTAVNYSPDTGLTWSTITYASLSVTLAGFPNVFHVSGNTWLLIDPTGCKVYRTTDNFATISLVVHPAFNAAHTFAKMHIVGSRVYIATHIASTIFHLVYSDDNGATWNFAIQSRQEDLPPYFTGISAQYESEAYFARRFQVARTDSNVSSSHVIRNLYPHGGSDFNKEFIVGNKYRRFEALPGANFAIRVYDRTLFGAFTKTALDRHRFSDGKIFQMPVSNIGYRQLKPVNGKFYVLPASSKIGSLSTVNAEFEFLGRALVSNDGGATYQSTSVLNGPNFIAESLLDVVYHPVSNKYYALCLRGVQTELCESVNGVDFSVITPAVAGTGARTILAVLGNYVLVFQNTAGGLINAYSVIGGPTVSVPGPHGAVNSMQLVGNTLYFASDFPAGATYKTLTDTLVLSTVNVGPSPGAVNTKSYVTIDGILHFWFGNDFYIRSDENDVIVEKPLPAGVYPNALLSGQNEATGNAGVAWAISPNHAPTLHKIRLRLI